MQEITLAEFEASATSVDAAALRTPDVDVFCSSTSWTLPAARALMPPGSPWLFAGEEGYIAAVRRTHQGLRCIEPLEAGWGLACPLLGPNPERIVAGFADLCRRHRGEWDVLLLSGIPRGSALLGHLVRALGGSYEIRFGPVTARHVASLAGGVDGFLSRRSRNFRKGLRRARRRAGELGIRFEHHRAADPDAAERAYERALAVEARSWKGRAGAGLAVPGMREFYRLMIRRLAADGRQRILIAAQEGRDIGYVLGGVLGDAYRGLQFSFDAEYERLSLGSLCQLEQIEDLCEEGYAEYDLGTGLDYKHRWAEMVRESVAVLVIDAR